MVICRWVNCWWVWWWYSDTFEEDSHPIKFLVAFEGWKLMGVWILNLVINPTNPWHDVPYVQYHPKGLSCGSWHNGCMMVIWKYLAHSAATGRKNSHSLRPTIPQSEMDLRWCWDGLVKIAVPPTYYNNKQTYQHHQHTITCSKDFLTNIPSGTQR